MIWLGLEDKGSTTLPKNVVQMGSEASLTENAIAFTLPRLLVLLRMVMCIVKRETRGLQPVMYADINTG